MSSKRIRDRGGGRQGVRRRDLRWQAEVAEDAPDDEGILDRGQQDHAAYTPR